MKYHIHVYKVSGKAELDVEAVDAVEARRKALEVRDKLGYSESDCSYVAVDVEGWTKRVSKKNL